MRSSSTNAWCPLPLFFTPPFHDHTISITISMTTPYSIAQVSRAASAPRSREETTWPGSGSRGCGRGMGVTFPDGGEEPTRLGGAGFRPRPLVRLFGEHRDAVCDYQAAENKGDKSLSRSLAGGRRGGRDGVRGGDETRGTVGWRAAGVAVAMAEAGDGLEDLSRKVCIPYMVRSNILLLICSRATFPDPPHRSSSLAAGRFLRVLSCTAIWLLC